MTRTRIKVIELMNGKKTYIAQHESKTYGWCELPWQFNHTIEDAKAAIDMFIAGQEKSVTMIQYP